MKITKMLKWYWQNSYWTLVGFYGAMLFLLLLTFCIMLFTGTEDVAVNNFSPASEIMLFVVGIVFFSAAARFGPSNGVSRKAVFCTFLLFFTAFSAGVMLVNNVGEQIGAWMGIETQQLQHMLYPEATGFGGWLSLYLCRTAIGLAMGLLGYFIGGAYYRMNTVWKIIVSITVPAILLVGLPLFFVTFPSIGKEVLENALLPLLNWVLLSPYCLTLLCLGLAVLLGFFTWLFIRRAPVKAAG